MCVCACAFAFGGDVFTGGTTCNVHDLVGEVVEGDIGYTCIAHARDDTGKLEGLSSAPISLPASTVDLQEEALEHVQLVYRLKDAPGCFCSHAFIAVQASSDLRSCKDCFAVIMTSCENTPQASQAYKLLLASSAVGYRHALSCGPEKDVWPKEVLLAESAPNARDGCNSPIQAGFRGAAAGVVRIEKTSAHEVTSFPMVCTSQSCTLRIPTETWLKRAWSFSQDSNLPLDHAHDSTGPISTSVRLNHLPVTRKCRSDYCKYRKYIYIYTYVHIKGILGICFSPNSVLLGFLLFQNRTGPMLPDRRAACSPVHTFTCLPACALSCLPVLPGCLGGMLATPSTCL